MSLLTIKMANTSETPRSGTNAAVALKPALCEQMMGLPSIHNKYSLVGAHSVCVCVCGGGGGGGA